MQPEEYNKWANVEAEKDMEKDMEEYIVEEVEDKEDFFVEEDM